METPLASAESETQISADILGIGLDMPIQVTTFRQRCYYPHEAKTHRKLTASLRYSSWPIGFALS